MNDLIEKTIAPPGINKPNRRALFSTVSDVFDKVKADALTAFNAHFPYLADSAKLEEHGRALLIPHLLDDTEKEYRERVSTASFFLMRAGERGYMTEQLTDHFGNRYIALEEFLHVFVKVTDLSEKDRHWLLEFLDSLINPNVQLTVSEWFHFIDTVLTTETQRIHLTTYGMSDSLQDGSFKYNGRVKYDGHTRNPTEWVPLKYDGANGSFKYNGTKKYSGKHEVQGTSYVRIPIKYGNGIGDILAIGVKSDAVDVYKGRVKYNGAWKFDGGIKYSGSGAVNDRFSGSAAMTFADSGDISENAAGSVVIQQNDRFTTAFRLDGYFKYNGALRYAAARENIRAALAMSSLDAVAITEEASFGMRPLRKYNGQYAFDGSFKYNGGAVLPLQEGL
ncbi:hypothetical protein FACS1894147_02580 [Spirochaetia bacterium]|nr:hypothetical protein FACS1894147_02580 [Spirochaetia bacterium]